MGAVELVCIHEMHMWQKRPLHMGAQHTVLHVWVSESSSAPNVSFDCFFCLLVIYLFVCLSVFQQ